MGSEASVVGLGIGGCLRDLVAFCAHLERNLNHWCSKRTCRQRREAMRGIGKKHSDRKIPVSSGSWLHEVYYLAKEPTAISNEGEVPS